MPRQRGTVVAAAATAAAAGAAAAFGRVERSGKSSAPAWVPPRALSGLGQSVSPRSFGSRLRLQRHSTATLQEPQDVDAPEDDTPEFTIKTHGLNLVVSFLVGPLLCFGFVRFRATLNNFLFTHAPFMEFGAYAFTSLLLFLVFRSNIVGRSAEAFVVLLCSLIEELNGHKRSWVSEAVRKLAPPLVNISQAMLLFLTVNLFVNAIPHSCAWRVPHMLRFCDLDGDGLLEAYEIEAMTYRLTAKILGCFAVAQAGHLVYALRQPLKMRVPESSKSIFAVYFRSIQRLKQRRRHKPGTRSSHLPNHALIWLLDVATSFATWLGCSLLWVRILGIPFHAVATALAPLGIGGLAFSLASKNIVQNLISGVLMFLNRAFTEGDEIHSVDGKISGVVSKVGLINTEVLRLQGDPVVVPNTELVNNGIVNLQRRDFWLIDQSLPLFMPSFERLNEVVAVMDKTLKEKVANVSVSGDDVKAISVYEEPLCYFEGFSHQGATIKARAYVDGSLPRHRFYQVRSEILLALNEVAFSFEGTGIAFEGHMLGNGRQWPGASSGHGHGHSSHEHTAKHEDSAAATVAAGEQGKGEKTKKKETVLDASRTSTP